MFLVKILYPFILNNEEYERVVVDNIEITYENERFVWRIVENNELNIKSTKELNLYNVTDLFDGKEDYLNEVKKLMNDFPKNNEAPAQTQEFLPMMSDLKEKLSALYYAYLTSMKP